MYCTTVNFTPQQIADLFVTAFEGGSNYWLQGVTHYHIQAHDKRGTWYEHGETFAGTFRITLKPDDDDEVTIRNRDVERALNHMAIHYPKTFADIITDNVDVETADVFLQLAAFNEIVYG